jgi:hypothetical protein
MDNLKKLNISQLVDILSTQTSLYIHVHLEGVSDTEFKKCRELIKAVQEEIKARKEVESQ